MSDIAHGDREWRFYVDDMIGFAEKVLAYTSGLAQSSFVADQRTYDATLRNLELMVRPQPIFLIRYAPPILKYRGV